MTTGLIGTDRRPVPDELPGSWGAELDQTIDSAHAVLSLAARHRAITRAGGLLRPARRVSSRRTQSRWRAARARSWTDCCPRHRWTYSTCGWTLAPAGQRLSASYWTPIASLRPGATRGGPDGPRSGSRGARRLVRRAESAVESARQGPAVPPAGRSAGGGVTGVEISGCRTGRPGADHARRHAMVG